MSLEKEHETQHTGEIVVYLADMCIPVSATSGRTRRHSAVHCDLVVPRTRLARYGSRGFAVSGPVTWRSLPPDLRITSLSAASLFSQLETELFIREHLVLNGMNVQTGIQN